MRRTLLSSFQPCRSAGTEAKQKLVVEQPLARFVGFDELSRVCRRACILRAQPLLLLERRDPLLQISVEGILKLIVVKLLKKLRDQALCFCGCGRVSDECHQVASGSECDVWCLVTFGRK